MPSMDILLSFSLAALLLSLSPGPSNLYIMARSISQGHNAGLAAAGGMAVGSFVYVLATAFGLAAIFIYFPLAFMLLKLAGAAYLLYLGWLYLFRHKPDEKGKPRVTVMSIPRIFMQSIFVELTNPKTALFFIAFLPQFIKQDSESVILQFAILGGMYALIAFMCDVCVAMLAGKLGLWLNRYPAFEVWQNRLSGGLLFSLGSYIAIDELVGRN